MHGRGVNGVEIHLIKPVKKMALARLRHIYISLNA